MNPTEPGNERAVQRPPATANPLTPLTLPALSLALVLTAFSLTTVADYDLWWHLNLGRMIAALGSIANPDGFSGTFAGSPQFNGEWLSDLLFYGAYRGTGLPGLYLVKITLLALTFLALARLLWELMEREAGPKALAIAVTLLIALFALRFRLYIRPYLFSYLFVALFLLLLLRAERKGDERYLWLLPLLQIVWVNLSKGALFGPVMTGIFLAGALLGRRRLTTPILLFVAVSAATCFNPEGWRIYGLFFDYSGKVEAITVGEHMPLSPQMLWGYGWHYTLGYQALVLLALLGILRRGGERSVALLALLALFFALSLRMVRMVDFFSLAAPLIAWRPVLSALTWVTRRTDAPLKWAFLAVVALTLASVPFSSSYRFGIGVKASHVPEGALAFLERVGVQGRLFNSYPFGGYIAWRAPAWKVFIDGRG